MTCTEPTHARDPLYCPECPHCRPVPPPCDPCAERRVAYAMLEFVSWQTLEPCCSDWFMASLPKAIVENIQRIQAMGPSGSIKALVDVLRERGYQGPIEDTIIALCDVTPFQGIPALKEDVARIHELWRQRRIIEVMHSIEACLRTGLKSSDGAIESMDRLRGEL